MDPDKERGLYGKYVVFKVVPGKEWVDPIEDFVFVLNPEKDPIAKKALMFYAELASEMGYHKLAADIWDRITNG